LCQADNILIRLTILIMIHNDIASNVVVSGEEKAEYRVQLFKSLDPSVRSHSVDVIIIGNNRKGVANVGGSHFNCSTGFSSPNYAAGFRY